MWQEVIERLALALGVTDGKKLQCSLQQIVGMAPSLLHGLHIRSYAPLTNEPIRIQTRFQGHDANIESLLGEQRYRLFCRVRPCIVRVEIDEQLLRVAAEEARLHFGEGCPTGGKNVLETGHVR